METISTSKYELERNKPMPSKLHSQLQSNLIFLLKLDYREKYNVLSELSLNLNGWSSVPDICIYPKTEMDFQTDEIQVNEKPLGIIEILSPTQSLQDLIQKTAKYFELGVKSSWIVIPLLKNIHVFESREKYQVFQVHEILKDANLDISLDLGEVFK